MKSEYFRTKTYGVKDPKWVMFFFPGAYTKLWWYRPVFFLLNRMKVQVVGFDFNWSMSGKGATLDMFLEIPGIVDESVKGVIKEHKGVKFAAFGSSYGTVSTLYVSKKNKKIVSVIVSVPYGRFSKLLWNYKRLSHIVEEQKAKGVNTEEKLNKLTRKIETLTDLGALKGKKVILFTDMRDKIVTDSLEFEAALAEKVPNSIRYRTRRGHWLGAMKHLYSFRKWKKALEK